VIGSSVFFHVPNDPNLHMEMAGGVEAWAGYRQAVKPCQFGLSFNIDLAATAFLTSGPMVNVLSKVCEGGEEGGCWLVGRGGEVAGAVQSVLVRVPPALCCGSHGAIGAGYTAWLCHGLLSGAFD
jgi:hypothetical protein